MAIIEDFTPKYNTFLESNSVNSILPIAEFVAEYCENYELNLQD